MRTFTNHIKMKFNGNLNYSFSFDIRYTEAEMYDSTLPNADLERNLKVKEDGYLYIQGYRITNNKDGIGKIYGSIFCVPEEQYIDVVLSINSSGYVVVTKKIKSENKVSRFLSKLLG
jgi:fibronectin type 3 domain-containing protein